MEVRNIIIGTRSDIIEYIKYLYGNRIIRREYANEHHLLLQNIDIQLDEIELGEPAIIYFLVYGGIDSLEITTADEYIVLTSREKPKKSIEKFITVISDNDNDDYITEQIKNQC